MKPTITTFATLLAIYTSVGALTAYAAPEGAPKAAAASVLTYGVGLELGYRDGFLNDREKTGQPRALGLDRARIALDWRTQRTASLALVLRPDTMNEEILREPDRRSGGPYRPEPTLHFLDAYLISIYPATSLATSIGVFEELAPVRRSYAPALDFGLSVRLPARFSGLRLRWQNANTAPDSAEATAAGTILADAYFLHGDEDRVETQGERGGAFDRAPTARDAHQGGAASLVWIPLNELELSLLWGTLDEKIIGGKRHEVMATFAAVGRFDVGPVPTKASLDVRAVVESWRGVDEKKREQRSASLTMSAQVMPNMWVLAGGHVGTSDRPNEVEVSGRQLEIGFLGSFGEELTLEVLVADERREQIDAQGAHLGGFVDPKGDEKKLRRYGLTLAYELEGKN